MHTRGPHPHGRSINGRVRRGARRLDRTCCSHIRSAWQGPPRADRLGGQAVRGWWQLRARRPNVDFFIAYGGGDCCRPRGVPIGRCAQAAAPRASAQPSMMPLRLQRAGGIPPQLPAASRTLRLFEPHELCYRDRPADLFADKAALVVLAARAVGRRLDDRRAALL